MDRSAHEFHERKRDEGMKEERRKRDGERFVYTRAIPARFITTVEGREEEGYNRGSFGK